MHGACSFWGFIVEALHIYVQISPVIENLRKYSIEFLLCRRFSIVGRSRGMFGGTQPD
jgi:hypothetical protein